MHTKRSLLIIDDDAPVAMALKALAEAAGLIVNVGCDRVSALDQLTATPPDIIVLDTAFEDEAGFDLLQTIREAGEARAPDEAPKIVLITPRRHPMDEEKGRVLGADAIIAKPFSGRDMLALIDDLRHHACNATDARPLLNLSHLRAASSMGAQTMGGEDVAPLG